MGIRRILGKIGEKIEAAGGMDHPYTTHLGGGRGNPVDGDIYNDRRSDGGTQPRRENPRPKPGDGHLGLQDVG